MYHEFRTTYFTFFGQDHNQVFVNRSLSLCELGHWGTREEIHSQAHIQVFFVYVFNPSLSLLTFLS